MQPLEEQLRAASRDLARLVDDSDDRRRPLGRWIVSGLAFLLVFALCLAGIGRLTSDPRIRFGEDTFTGRKLAWLAEHGDEVDLVFLGTSRVFRQIDPVLFDAELARRGHPLRSYNLGIGGATESEITHVLRWLLEREGESPRWVLVEPHTFRFDILDENHLTRRSIELHTLEFAGPRILRPFSTRSSWKRKGTVIGRHLRNAGYRLGNVGLGLPTARRLLGFTPEAPIEVGRAGFVPLDEEDNKLQRERRAELLEQWPELGSERVADFAADPDEGQDRALGRFVTELDEILGAADRRWAYLSTPPRWKPSKLNAELTDAPLFDQHDPRRNPEYYELERLYNWNHLNAAGAELLTRALAGQFADHLDRAD